MSVKYCKLKGCWEASYSKRHRDSKQPITLRRTGFKTKSEALRVEKRLVVLVSEKANLDVIPKWPQSMAEYWQKCRIDGLTEKTINNGSKCLAKATIPLWEDRFITEISTDEIRFLVKETYGHFSKHYQKAILKWIRLVFRFAVENGHLERNPAPHIKYKLGEKVTTVLKEKEIEVLLSKARELDWPWYYHYCLALYTGMRSGELFALTWDKVDFDRNLIVVNESWNNKDGFKQTKSGHDRIVEIASNLKPLLLELKQIRGDKQFVLERIPCWAKGEQARELRKFLMAIGLPEVRFHDLRASWCTLMLDKGVEATKVMSMGGWRDIKTLMHYIRMAGVNIKGATEVLDFHKLHHEVGESEHESPLL
jgi:integrase